MPIGLIASLKAVKIVKEIKEDVNVETGRDRPIEPTLLSEIDSLAENKVETVIENVLDAKVAPGFP